MTVPQYPPKRPQPSGEMVQLQIHIVGNGHSAVPHFCSAEDWNGTGAVPYNTKKETAHHRVRQKEKGHPIGCPCVGITYFHGPSPGNYRRRK